MIKAGFFECDITPPLGADRPADFMKLKIQKISDPLKVRALALHDGERYAVLIGIDNSGVGNAFLKKVTDSLPGIDVIFSASHTHYGGNLRDKFPGIDTADDVLRRIVLVDSVSHDANYYEFCLRQTLTAVKVALERLEEVDFSFGSGKVENLIFNRRIRMKDGSCQTHPGKVNPDAETYAGPVDDQLGVIGIWKKNTDELLGFALNFSCHACINLEGATADFPGVSIDTVRAVYGKNAGAVYLNGASGDVTQIDNLSLKKDMGKAIAIKLGRAVGAEAIKILACADRGSIQTLQYLKKTLGLTRMPADLEELQNAYAIAKEYADTSEYKIAKTLVMQDIIRKNDPTPQIGIAALQIGPLVIGSVPGELFAQYALDFKKNSHFPFCWLTQLSASIGYIPTANAFSPKCGGGYEASTAPFVPETGGNFVEMLLSLQSQWSPEALPVPETVQPSGSAWGYNFKRKDRN